MVQWNQKKVIFNGLSRPTEISNDYKRSSATCSESNTTTFIHCWDCNKCQRNVSPFPADAKEGPSVRRTKNDTERVTIKITNHFLWVNCLIKSYSPREYFRIKNNHISCKSIYKCNKPTVGGNFYKSMNSLKPSRDKPSHIGVLIFISHWKDYYLFIYWIKT